MTFHNTASNFRLMLDQTDRIIIAPGVFDGLSARIALSLGYEALYMVGKPLQHVCPQNKSNKDTEDRSWNIDVKARLARPRPRDYERHDRKR